MASGNTATAPATGRRDGRGRRSTGVAGLSLLVDPNFGEG
jgi:hypothetical protein